MEHIIETNKALPNENEKRTRMHSSRMRTIPSSGHLGDVCPGGCLARGGMSAWGSVHLPLGQNDRCLWKHYLSATTVADGNKKAFQ